MTDTDYYRLLSIISFPFNYVWISLPTTLNDIICMAFRPGNPKSAICTAERSDEYSRRFHTELLVLTILIHCPLVYFYRFLGVC